MSKSYGKGEELWLEPKVYYRVESGMLGLCQLTSSGGMTISDFALPGDLIWASEDIACYWQTLTASEVSFTTTMEYQVTEALDKHLKHSRLLAYLRGCGELAEVRAAYLLDYLLPAFTQEKSGTIPLAQQEVSELLGVDRVSVTRILKRAREERNVVQLRGATAWAMPNF